MNSAIIVWVLIAILTAIYGYILRGKWTAVALAVAVSIAAFVGLPEFLGYPKPIWMEWRFGKAKVDVLFAEFRENEAIYLVVRVPWDDVPRLYILPWSEQEAVELHKSLSESEETGEGVQMEMPFGPFVSDDAEHPVYKLPIPQAPLKQGQ